MVWFISYFKAVPSIQVLLLVRFSWKIPGPQLKILNIHPSEGVILPNENQVYTSSAWKCFEVLVYKSLHCLKRHLTLFCACAAIWFLIRRNSFQSRHLRGKSFSIDLARFVRVKITMSRNCLVICEGFKPRILYFYLNIVEKFDVLERRYSKRLWTKAPVAS